MSHQGDNPNQRRGRQSSGSENQGQPYQQPTRQQAQGQQPYQQSTGTPQQQPQHFGRSQQSAQQRGTQQLPQQQLSGQAPQSGRQQAGQYVNPQQPMQYQQTPQHAARQQSQFQAQQHGSTMAQQMPTGQAGGQGTGGVQSRRGGVQMRPITIEDIVATDVVTAEPDTPISEVVSEMADNDVGSVVIVEDDSPVGIITDREVAIALADTPDIADQQAGDLVSGDLVTATTSMTVFDAVRRMNDEAIRRLPIVDDDGSLQGIISLDDILVLLGNELNRVGETIQAQSPRL